MAVPEVAPMVAPLLTLIVAFDDELYHAPPAGLLERAVEDPTHSVVVPVIVAGSAFTVIDVVTKQPSLTRYVMVVFPAAIPETTPVDEFTVATAVLADDQVPPLTG